MNNNFTAIPVEEIKSTSNLARVLRNDDTGLIRFELGGQADFFINTLRSAVFDKFKEIGQRRQSVSEQEIMDILADIVTAKRIADPGADLNSIGQLARVVCADRLLKERGTNLDSINSPQIELDSKSDIMLNAIMGVLSDKETYRIIPLYEKGEKTDFLSLFSSHRINRDSERRYWLSADIDAAMLDAEENNKERLDDPENFTTYEFCFHGDQQSIYVTPERVNFSAGSDGWDETFVHNSYFNDINCDVFLMLKDPLSGTSSRNNVIRFEKGSLERFHGKLIISDEANISVKEFAAACGDNNDFSIVVIPKPQIDLSDPERYFNQPTPKEKTYPNPASFLSSFNTATQDFLQSNSVMVPISSIQSTSYAERFIREGLSYFVETAAGDPKTIEDLQKAITKRFSDAGFPHTPTRQSILDCLTDIAVAKSISDNPNDARSIREMANVVSVDRHLRERGEDIGKIGGSHVGLDSETSIILGVLAKEFLEEGPSVLRNPEGISGKDGFLSSVKSRRISSIDKSGKWISLLDYYHLNDSVYTFVSRLGENPSILVKPDLVGHDYETVVYNGYFDGFDGNVFLYLTNPQIDGCDSKDNSISFEAGSLADFHGKILIPSQANIDLHEFSAACGDNKDFSIVVIPTGQSDIDEPAALFASPTDFLTFYNTNFNASSNQSGGGQSSI